MMNTTLVVMAAGIGSRFGGGIKQLTPVGPGGELIIDYSVHDALEAGFNKVIFIIRKDIEADFKSIIGDRLQQQLKCEIQYAYQSIDDLPMPHSVPNGRIKPWGTGQAVLSCKGLLNEPFCVINADDYYGKEAFCKIHDYLVAHRNEPGKYCMAGFILENTLSENGGVTRGICRLDGDKLTGVVETHGIMKAADGAEANGVPVDVKSYVSMNMWGLSSDFIDILEDGFKVYLDNLGDNEMKAEYLLPTIIDKLIQEGKASVTMLETRDKWFGVTYAEDKASVHAEFKKLVDAGAYKSPLI